MSRGRSLDTIKQRISDLKVKIDECEEREAYAKSELVTVKEREMKNETEARSLRNRIDNLKDDLAKVEGKNSDNLRQLDQNTQRSEDSENTRKQLEEKEEEGFEKTREIEDSARSAKFNLEEIENRQKEAALREKALVSDLNRVEDNYKKNKEMEDELQRQFDDKTTIISSLENDVNALHEKEDDYKEKIAFLDDQIKQVANLEEERTAKIKTSERLKDKLLDELQREKDKLHEIEKQFEEIESGV